MDAERPQRRRAGRSSPAVRCIRPLSVISRIRLDGGSPVSSRTVPDRLDEVRLLELAGREVDADPELRQPEAELPLAGLAARLAQDPAAHRDDVAGLLGDVDELARHQQRPVRRLPADERLEPDDRAAAELDDRLVVEAELAAVLDAAQLAGEVEPRGGLRRAGPSGRPRPGRATTSSPRTSRRRRCGAGRRRSRRRCRSGRRRCSPRSSASASPRFTGWRSVSARRIAIESAVASSPTSSSSTANSSPPRRAAVSDGRSEASTRARGRDQDVVAAGVAAACR